MDASPGARVAERRPDEALEEPREASWGTARTSFVATSIAVLVVAGAIALWKLKLVIALVFLAFVIAAAMRPGVDALRRRGVPRGVGVAVHYVVALGLIAVFMWFAVPRALTQVEAAVGSAPTTAVGLKQAARHSTGIKHQVLTALAKELTTLKSGTTLVHPAVSVTKTAFEALVAIIFVFATAAYWIFERDQAVDLLTSLIARPKRKKVRDTIDLIDGKLGAFVRGELLLIAFVAVLLSLAFWLCGEPYWLLLGPAAGVLEAVPIVGPIVAGVAAVGVGLTVSWHVALAAGLAVLLVRVLEDYVVTPRVLGHAVGLSPLVILVSVLAVAGIFGGLTVLLAIPIVAVLATIVDVTVRGKDPAEEEVPTVLFPAKDTE